MALEHLNNYDKAIIKNFVFFSNIYLLFKGHWRAAVSRVSKERANGTILGAHLPESFDSNFENPKFAITLTCSPAEGYLSWQYLFLKLNLFSHCTKPFLFLCICFIPSGCSAEFQVKLLILVFSNLSPLG